MNKGFFFSVVKLYMDTSRKKDFPGSDSSNKEVKLFPIWTLEFYNRWTTGSRVSPTVRSLGFTIRDHRILFRG